MAHPSRLLALGLICLAPLTATAQNQALSVSVNGGSGYLEMPNSPTLTPPNLTIEAWITYIDSGLPAGFLWPTIVRKNFVNGQADYFLRVDAGNANNRVLRAWLNGTGGVVNVSFPFAAGAFLGWTHVAVTYDGAFARLYVNGNQVAQSNGTGALVGTATSARIGAGDTAVGAANEYWNGLIEEVRIWSVARTPAEIQSNMFASIPSAANLNASYLLDGNGLDFSGNVNDAMTIGTPAWPFVAFPAPTWETNDSGSSLDFNGVQGSGLAKASTQVCTSTLLTANSQGSLGLPWEAVYNLSPTVPAGNPGALVTPMGQILNVDVTAGLTFLFGGLAPAPLAHPGTFSMPISAPPVAATFSIQQVIVGPVHPDGYALSQAAQLDTIAINLPALPTAGPVGDDVGTVFNIGCMVFYGRSFSTVWVQSNGRLTFGASNTTFTPTAAAFATNPASMGCWTDFNSAAGGTITVSQPLPGVFQAAYNGVFYFSTTTPNTFQLELDTTTGIASIINLTGLAAGTGNMLIGVSGGTSVLATNPGLTDFSPGGLGFAGLTSNGTDMIYNLGVRGAVTSGITRIDFLPNSFNNYDWVSF